MKGFYVFRQNKFVANWNNIQMTYIDAFYWFSEDPYFRQWKFSRREKGNYKKQGYAYCRVKSCQSHLCINFLIWYQLTQLSFYVGHRKELYLIHKTCYYIILGIWLNSKLLQILCRYFFRFFQILLSWFVRQEIVPSCNTYMLGP